MVLSSGSLTVRLSSLANSRYSGVVQRFFHRRIRQAGPLLKEMDAQHGLDRERGTAALAFRGVWSDQHHQIGPRHNAVHLVQKFALAGAPGRQVQSKGQFFSCATCLLARPSHCKHIRRQIVQSILGGNGFGTGTHSLPNIAGIQHSPLEHCASKALSPTSQNFRNLFAQSLVASNGRQGIFREWQRLRRTH